MREKPEVMPGEIASGIDPVEEVRKERPEGAAELTVESSLEIDHRWHEEKRPHDQRQEQSCHALAEIRGVVSPRE